MSLFDNAAHVAANTLNDVFAEFVALDAPVGQSGPSGVVLAVYVAQAVTLTMDTIEAQSMSPAFDFFHSNVSGEPVKGSIITRESGSRFEVKDVELQRDRYRAFVYAL